MITSGLSKLAPGLVTTITGSRFFGPIINGVSQFLSKAPAFVQRMTGGLFSKVSAMTATEGAITSGVDDWLRGKELNWKRAVLSALARATLVGFASGTYPLVQPLINKVTVAIEKHAGPVVTKTKTVIQNVDNCVGYQRTPRYFALIRFRDGNFVECLYAQADRGGGGSRSATKAELSATQIRNSPGIVKGSNLKAIDKMMRGSHGNVGIISKEVGDQLKGKRYNNFDNFRKDFWKAVANSKYKDEFGASNISRMSQGLAPIVSKSQQYGKVKSYILHHKTPIHDGGGVYDLDNLIIVTPKMHQ